MQEKLVLIDGNSIINRAFYGLPQLSNSKGVHTNAVYGFMNILLKILGQEKPSYLAVAFDLKGPTFRHKMYAEYKGNRKGMPEDLAEQMPLLKNLLKAMKISIVELEGYEADDLLGTLAKRGEKAGMKVSVISGDRDLLQLVTDNIMVRIPKTKSSGTEVEDYTPEDVKEKYQLSPSQIIDLKAIMGDSSDNYGGVPGIGEKGATKLLVEFGSVEEAYARIEEISATKTKNALREHYDQALLCKKLATIETETPLEYDFEQARIGSIYTREAYEILQELELKRLKDRFYESMEKGENPWEAADEDSPFGGSFSMEESLAFQTLSDLDEIEKVCREAEEQPVIGLAFGGSAPLCAIALSWDREHTFCLAPEGFVTPDFLFDRIKELIKKGNCVSILSLKKQIKTYDIIKGDNYFDGELAAYLLNPLKESYSFEELARNFLGENLSDRTALIGKQSIEQAWETAQEKVLTLFAQEAYVSAAIVKPLSDKLKEEGMEKLFYELEMPLTFVLSNMEKVGMLVNGQALVEYGENLETAIDKLEKEIYELAGEQFNINSPKQLGELLFVKLGLPGGKKTKTGYSTSAEVLEKLAPEHPIIDKILEYRQLAKLNSTYAKGLVSCIKEDGRIHSTFEQTVTATGRLSSTDPNLQNIPIRMELGRLIRKVFVPKEGCIYVDADYSQIELRVLAHLSGDKTLIQAYHEDDDIHRITASQVFHVKPSEVTSELRRRAKAVNFGIVYGISSFGLSRDLNISRQEAKE